MAKSVVTVTRLVNRMVAYYFATIVKKDLYQELQDATHDWVVVFQQLLLGKIESSCVVDGELQHRTSKPDEIGAQSLRLLGVGLFLASDIDDHEVSLPLCKCLGHGY